MFRIDVCDKLMKCWAVMEVREVAHLVDNDASDTTIRYADEMSVECDMSGRRT
jgi:nucleosome binding factor SPN SPT16 subunit